MIPGGMTRRRSVAWMVGGLLGLMLAFGVHVAFGTVPIDPLRVVKALAQMPDSRADYDIVWNLRTPRALVVLGAGAMLGLAGALLQAITRNPLAEPGLMGVSGGAVLAIVVAIVAQSKLDGLGIVRDTGLALGLVGIAGGMAAGTLTYVLSWRQGSDPALLVLIGVLVAGGTAALASMVLLVADENQVRLVLHWMIGSANGRVWAHWHMMWPLGLAGLALGLGCAGLANALQLGDPVAAGLGVSVERTRLLLLFVAAVLTSGAVSVVGAIGFVGLMGPHLARQMVGTDARRLFPFSVLVSAGLLLLADIAARLFPLGWLAGLTGLALPGRSGMPMGVATPLLGAPFFLYLLLRRRRQA